MNKKIELMWDFSPDSAIAQKIRVKIQKIKKASSGFLGYKRYASYLYSSWDTNLIGIVLSEGKYVQGKTIELLAPKNILAEVKPGEIVELDISRNTQCIGISTLKTR
jgi:hypothetical protein